MNSNQINTNCRNQNTRWGACLTLCLVEVPLEVELNTPSFDLPPNTGLRKLAGQQMKIDVKKSYAYGRAE
jgi:hypothetical protein